MSRATLAHSLEESQGTLAGFPGTLFHGRVEFLPTTQQTPFVRRRGVITLFVKEQPVKIAHGAPNDLVTVAHQGEDHGFGIGVPDGHVVRHGATHREGVGRLGTVVSGGFGGQTDSHG